MFCTPGDAAKDEADERPGRCAGGRDDHFDDTGTLTVTSQEPKNAKEKPKGDSDRWFSTKAKTAVVVRRKATETKVETFTLADPKPKDTSVTADGAFSNPPKGSKPSLKGTKLF